MYSPVHEYTQNTVSMCMYTCCTHMYVYSTAHGGGHRLSHPQPHPFPLLLTTIGPMTANWSYRNLASSMSHAWKVTYSERDNVCVRACVCVCVCVCMSACACRFGHYNKLLLHYSTVRGTINFRCSCLLVLHPVLKC